MTEMNSPSLLGLIGRINHAASDIRKRTASIADILGGSCPATGSGKTDAPEPADMHSQLQRILSKLEHIHDNLRKTERTLGVCGSQGAETEEAEQSCESACDQPVALARAPSRY